jgi:hypothetical protein
MILKQQIREEFIKKTCEVRWEERGYPIVCGAPYPCSVHTSEEEREQYIDSLLTQAVQEEREELVNKIRKWKAWKLVPNTPRMIMVGDKELDTFLISLLNK